MVEKVALNRFSGHVEVNDLNELSQLPYKEHHSVSTAVVKVYVDLLCAVDSMKMIPMTLLDLSMAFNTVDQRVMMNRLERCFGVTGSALILVKSYFSNQH